MRPLFSSTTITTTRDPPPVLKLSTSTFALIVKNNNNNIITIRTKPHSSMTITMLYDKEFIRRRSVQLTLFIQHQTVLKMRTTLPHFRTMTKTLLGPLGWMHIEDCHCIRLVRKMTDLAFKAAVAVAHSEALAVLDKLSARVLHTTTRIMTICSKARKWACMTALVRPKLSFDTLLTMTPITKPHSRPNNDLLVACRLIKTLLSNSKCTRARRISITISAAICTPVAMTGTLLCRANSVSFVMRPMFLGLCCLRTFKATLHTPVTCMRPLATTW
jgi:hypothetical protein